MFRKFIFSEIETKRKEIMQNDAAQENLQNKQTKWQCWKSSYLQISFQISKFLTKSSAVGGDYQKIID